MFIKILSYEKLYLSKRMWDNFLCIIFSENYSKINAIYELIFRPQMSILGLLKSNLGLSDSIVRICEAILGRARSCFWLSGSRFLASGSRFFGPWVSIFCLWKLILGLWESIFGLSASGCLASGRLIGTS